ncbi:alkaline phytoceramidase [Laetiporus sulphureus 93-53]|uniref:Alkaline phytoceramidase n=1 Tax=Laetiporus sulphureus 93-53 TaxID=1314785 RepID=A0A165FB99_9APHY|nr:alkaline phytoceramidase [Laetiporus sulphureus 93-53]KZT08705.1 alkaline phytoceramidase [Laetiporus sulphureus 93-53]
MDVSNSTVLLIPHFWGPVTATLDWCEANYQFSSYIAETANTFSNLFTVGLALFGAYQARAQSLPPRYLAGYSGFALVGVGSFIFHATLLFEAQLADELPMVYVASYCCAILFDTTRGFGLKDSRRALSLAAAVISFNVLFTWSYYISRNPIYHQVVFAALLGITGVRTIYLLRDQEIAKRVPEEVKSTVARLFSFGAATFAFGFFVWNLDNIFCGTITRWKHALGWPAAFILEGHSWWHILTATGTYLMLVGNTYFTLCIKDDYQNFGIEPAMGLPCIRRVHRAKAQ